MENISNNKVLCLNDESNLSRKKKAILSYLTKGIDVLAVFDTETTGTNVYPDKTKGSPRDRILEVGFVMYYIDNNDELKPIILDGKPVGFQEYVNPFREDKKTFERAESRPETHPEAFEVHKISNEFLFGRESFNGIKLHKPAPTFAEMKPFMEDFLCLNESSELEGKVHFVAHNGQKFDAPMLTEEMYLVDQYNPDISLKSTFESKIESLIDTMKVMQDLYDKQDLLDKKGDSTLKPGYSMSYLAQMLNVKEEGRENFHGAFLDSTILANVFNALMKTKEWQNAPNKIKIKKMGETETNKKIIPLPKLSEGSSDISSPDILTVIKTDASQSEGTGTIKEYVSAAKEAGLKSLVLADVVTVSRFVEFYEACLKEEIKPIIGTTFKVESENDVFNFIESNKASGVSDDLFNIITPIINTHVSNKQFNSLDDIVREFDVDSVTLNKVMLPILELNRKKYSSRKTTQDAINKLVDRIARVTISLTKEKYDKKKVNVKLIESSVSASNNLIKAKEFSHATGYSDLLLIANNDNGFETIKKLISKANESGQHFLKKGTSLGRGENPLITMDMLKELNESVTALIGHKNDILGKAVKAGDVKRSQLIIRDLKNIFGENIKAQITTSEQTLNRESENKFISNIKTVCEKQGISSVAAHHAAYAKRSDFTIHVNKYAILEDKTATAVTLDTGVSKEEHIQSMETLVNKFSENTAMVSESKELIDKTTLNPVLHKPSLPKFKTGNSNTQAEELQERALKGLKKKLPPAFKKAVAKGKVENTKEAYLKFCNEYKERLDYELKIITDMDFPGYFLIKQQMIEFCKQEGIVVGAGRGSAAGSLTVYSLGITDADPIEHGLIFERFLNPERKEMPDIDTDIDGNAREKVLQFLCDQYKEDGLGYSGAAFIMTKGTFSARNSLRRMAKAEGLSLNWADILAKTVSDEPGVKLEDEIENNEVLSIRYHTEAKTRDIIDKAIDLEKNGGRQVSIGKHAGGVVVGNIISQAPITYVKNIPVVQADKNDIESLGAVKFDLLGSETLTKLDLALKNVEANRGEEELNSLGILKEGKSFNFDNFQYDDKATYEMLQAANSTNVFQIESNIFKNLLKEMKPENLEEITALVSLGRPGPMQSHMDKMFTRNKFDPSKRERLHPLIDHLLDETHGTIIYQEQVMAIAQKLSGFTMGGADKLRKAMGKKKIEEMHKQKSLFVEGALKNGVDEELSTEIFDTIEKFAGYGFNKSHALAYSLLTYKMAYLRRNYPTETMAAIMSIDALSGKASERLEKDNQSCKEVGLTLFTPNINTSNNEFTPGKTTGILYGLSGIKGASFDKVLAEREKNGLFTNLENFMVRVGAAKSTEKLIDTGAMDSLSLTIKPSDSDLEYLKSLSKEEAKIAKRLLLKDEYAILKEKLSSAAKIKSHIEGDFDKDQLNNNFTKTLRAFSKNTAKYMSNILDIENELLGGYVTTHPLKLGNIRETLKNLTSNPEVPLSSLSEVNENLIKSKFSVAGCVKKVVFDKVGKTGNKFAIIELNDESSTTPIFMGNDLFLKLNNEIKAKTGRGLQEGSILGVDVSFYKKDTVKTSVDAIYFPEQKIKVEKEQYYSNKNKRR